MLEGVLPEFGVRGVDRPDPPRPRRHPVRTGARARRQARPGRGPVRRHRPLHVAPAPAASAWCQGRNAIGIELPNAKRETVYLRDLLASTEYDKTGHLLPLALGETIGGEPYVADLARMPHLLIAGTTGSGKSVGVNAMILSILYRHQPGRMPLHHDRPQDAGAVGL